MRTWGRSDIVSSVRLYGSLLWLGLTELCLTDSQTLTGSSVVSWLHWAMPSFFTGWIFLTWSAQDLKHCGFWIFSCLGKFPIHNGMSLKWGIYVNTKFIYVPYVPDTYSLNVISYLLNNLLYFDCKLPCGSGMALSTCIINDQTVLGSGAL